MADIFAPGLAFGLVIHRLGCLGAGCCYGKPLTRELPWGLNLHEALRHPTQLYEAIPLAFVATALLFSWHRRRFLGEVTWWFALAYAPIRILGEGFRGSPSGLLMSKTVTSSALLE